MTAAALVEQLRSRGVRLRMAGAVLQVAPRDCLTDADRAALHEQVVELKALVQAEVAAALVADIFGPGTRVVASGQPAAWPPQGGWAPSRGTIDLYGTEAPTVACRCCAAVMWGRAGDGWCCRRCHPDPRLAQAERASELRGTKSPTSVPR